MAALPSLTLLLLFASTLLPLFLLLSVYIKRRRHRGHHPNGEQAADEPQRHQDIPEWLSPPPSPPLLQDADLKVGGEEVEKRRRKKGRRKRGAESQGVSEEDGSRAEMVGLGGKNGGGKASSPYPFSSFASATQRKIKLQYDRLVRSNQSKALTMDQVGQFVNCLVEARNELQHKSETIQRSFKIKKALLFKADRSSFDRLCQQIYKLEAEHKRLEEDAAVYNLLQEQLKLSPAYKTMLEIDASVELNATSDQAMEISDISFEELLAQEKKDSFWQKYGKQRACAS